jgi:hypothetical protein
MALKKAPDGAIPTEVGVFFSVNDGESPLALTRWSHWSKGIAVADCDNGQFVKLYSVYGRLTSLMAYSSSSRAEELSTEPCIIHMRKPLDWTRFSHPH